MNQAGTQHEKLPDSNNSNNTLHFTQKPKVTEARLPSHLRNVCIQSHMVSRWIFIVCLWPCIIQHRYDAWNFFPSSCLLAAPQWRNALAVSAVVVMLLLECRGWRDNISRFCSWDRDLDPMTFICEFDQYAQKIYQMSKMNFVRQGFQKLSSDRQTDRHD